MMTKLRASVFAILSGVLLLPIAASAQFAVPDNTGLPAGGVKDIIFSAMNWLLIVIGALAIIGFLIAAILYLTSAGDDSKTEKAKNAMIASIIGVIVALVGVVVMNAVKTWLGGDSTSF